MRYSIWQMPVSNENTFTKFQDDKEYKLDDYVHVYMGNGDDLDQIYMELNVDHPDDYHARSLSVSDLVRFENDTWFYVDLFGFTEVVFDRKTNRIRRAE